MGIVLNVLSLTELKEIRRFQGFSFLIYNVKEANLTALNRILAITSHILTCLGIYFDQVS